MTIGFKRNLLAGFGVSLLLLIVSSVASYNSIVNLIDSTKWVTHTYNVIDGLNSCMSYLKDAETSQRGFLLTGREDFLKPYQGAYDSVLARINDVSVLTADSEAQQANVNKLKELVTGRFNQLSILIDKKRNDEAIVLADLEKGKSFMDDTRALVRKMRKQEEALLAERTDKLNQLVGFTPLIILVATILAFVITLYSLIRVNSDFNKRAAMQRALEQKDEEITHRINIIRDIADKISAGDYETRITDSGKDDLGDLSFSLNTMAESLQYSFNLLSDKEWLQAGVAKLNEKVIGEYDINVLTQSIIEFVALYTDSHVGAFYLRENNDVLQLANGYAFAGQKHRTTLHIGEGLAGECARAGKELLLTDVPADQVMISFATGDIKPVNIIAFPLLYERRVVGVIELASLVPYTARSLSFIEAASHVIGVALNGVENRKKLQELLEETQAQAEELQAQHSELEAINEEMEVQTQKLQASEEELKVQQEELKESNAELEERTRLLEEKNQLIFERNVEIQRKAEQLALSTKYKSEFLANMSHELRTPLNSILLLSRLMAENNEHNLNSDQVEYANVILSSGQGLLALIDEILDLSKIESGKMELDYSNVLLGEITNDMNALFVPMAKQKGISFDVSVAPDAPGMIETDKMRLEQILKNLLSNALKFTSQGSVSLRFQPSDRRDILAITVRDTGIGISKEKQQLIFEAFQQADGSTRRKYGGTGLGLSISRELVKLLGGSIELQSEVNEGSVFTVYVPVSKAAAALQTPKEPAKPVISTTEELVEQELKAVEFPAAAERYIADIIPENVPDDRKVITPADNTILIVEDDVNFAKSLLEYTRKKGYKGIVSVRGDEAVPLAMQYQPAGILLDIQLPVKDGWEVMEMLKSNQQTRHIPVHIMSSYEFKYQSISKGAVDFINKPVAFEQMHEIFEKIEHVLNSNPRKVLIVEENPKHAKALAYFLETFKVSAEIKDNVGDSVEALSKQEVNCVILDMGIPDQSAYDTLEQVKKSPGLENLPIIIFTGKSLSKAEELRIKKYADSIVIKTAHSYQRILDEVSLFLHLVEEKKESEEPVKPYKSLGLLQDVLKDKKVLIADDDVRNIYSLSKSLESLNMTVVSAMDGKEALKQLEVHPDIDVVLMDMMMPEMDGYESIRHIRALDKFKRLPIIAVTAKAMTGDRAKCISAGASDYITKPVDIDQLLSLLRVWLYER
ncbi:response regulator [Filimonas effusa]|uniref:histidine kinase n=2 Tax=Filimonas effusa TaxID=2508721 RepID=A0A4Q1DD45_9BACT|nr:response regulator [Filimonas effusa]